MEQNIKEKIINEIKDITKEQDYINKLKKEDIKMTWNKINSHPQYTLEIKESKQFAYDSQRKEWLWYKNLVLPNININLKTNESYKPPQNNQSPNQKENNQDPENTRNNEDLQQEKENLKENQNSENPQENSDKNDIQNTQNTKQNPLTACIFCLRYLDGGSIDHVQLVGNQMQELQNKQATFIGLKFSENTFTSKTNHILLIVTVANSVTGETYGITGSPPLLLEARRKCWLRRKNTAALFDVFMPDLIDKQYEKISKDKNVNVRGFIKNDLEGLMYYFCNPYIRHKIMHPLFLLLKFHKAITLYYNTEVIQQLPQGEIIKILQIQINQHLTQQDNNERYSNFQKPLLLVIQSKDQDKQVIEKVATYLKVLNGPVISCHKSEPFNLPQYFKPIKFSTELKQEYKLSYNLLQRIKFEGGSQNLSQPFLSQRDSDFNILQSDAMIPQLNSKRSSIPILDNDIYQQSLKKLKSQQQPLSTPILPYSRNSQNLPVMGQSKNQSIQIPAQTSYEKFEGYKTVEPIDSIPPHFLVDRQTNKKNSTASEIIINGPQENHPIIKRQLIQQQLEQQQQLQQQQPQQQQQQLLDQQQMQFQQQQQFNPYSQTNQLFNPQQYNNIYPQQNFNQLNHSQSNPMLNPSHSNPMLNNTSSNPNLQNMSNQYNYDMQQQQQFNPQKQQNSNGFLPYMPFKQPQNQQQQQQQQIQNQLIHSSKSQDLQLNNIQDLKLQMQKEQVKYQDQIQKNNLIQQQIQ